MRRTKLIGLLLLCVYAAAMVHQILPHGPGHGRGETCALCLLLTTLVVFVAGVGLVLGELCAATALIAHAGPHSERVTQPFSPRGPPPILF
jgi:hypothetical protein